jgi:hypothetical protein
MSGTYIGVGTGLGVCLGAAAGSVLGNVGLGVALGLCFGTALGAIVDAFNQPAAGSNASTDKPLPDPLGLFHRDESERPKRS